MNDIPPPIYLLMPLAAEEYSYVHFPSSLARWPLAVWQGPWQGPRFVSYVHSSVDGGSLFLPIYLSHLTAFGYMHV